MRNRVATELPQDVFKAYYPRLCDFACRFLKDMDEAEDVVQDVFVAFLERDTAIRKQDSTTKAFLYAAVKNACLNRLRREGMAGRYLQHAPPEETDERDALYHLIHAEVIGEIHQAMDTLPPGCALVLRKGYLEGLKNPEIAEQLGVSINTVKSQKQRALLLLREKLTPQAMALLLPFLLS